MERYLTANTDREVTIKLIDYKNKNSNYEYIKSFVSINIYKNMSTLLN